MIDSNAAEKRRDYLREWRRKHPEKVKQYNESYWQRKAEQEQRRQDADNRKDRA